MICHRDFNINTSTGYIKIISEFVKKRLTCTLNFNINDDIDNYSQCNEFSCNEIKRLNNDGKSHHSEAIENLKLLEEIGEEK
jgi:hypothetical protein